MSAESARSPLQGEERAATRVLSVVPYFAITFVMAWLLWSAAALFANPQSNGRGVRGLLFLPGTFSPGIVALWLTLRSEGHAGVRKLLSRMFCWEVSVKWYVFAVGYMAGVKLLAAVAHWLSAGVWPAFGQVPFYVLLGGVLLSTPFQAGEEIGWRGYALPRLAERIGLARGSLVLGIIWACWHLPLFYIAGTDTTGQPFPVYAVSVTAISVAMAWLFVRTKGSLLLVMLLHSAVNNTTGIVPGRVSNPSNPLVLSATSIAWLTAVILWLGAVYFLFRLRTVRPDSLDSA